MTSATNCRPLRTVSPTRPKHRAGPVETEKGQLGATVKVQRCLRCDALVSVEHLDDEFPRPVGAFIKVGKERCAGEIE